MTLAALALFNDDIFQIVLRFFTPRLKVLDKEPLLFDATLEVKQFWSSCHSLALVCKALSHSALDALWRDLYDLESLLRLLPSFQRENPDWSAFESIVSIKLFQLPVWVSTVDPYHRTPGVYRTDRRPR